MSTITASTAPKNESALQAIFREVNLPQLITLFFMLAFFMLPIAGGCAWWLISRDSENAKDKAVMQEKMAGVTTHLDKIDLRADSQALILGTLITGQTEGKSKLDNLSTTTELIRQDVQALRSHVR